MRKFSKLLLILLTVSLLFGMTAVFAFAEEEISERERLNITDHSANVYNALDDASTGGSYGGKYEYAWGGLNKDLALNYISGEENSYLAVRNNPSPSGSVTSGQMLWKVGNYSFGMHSTASANTFEYMVVDLEFGTDRYVYTFNGKKHTADSLDDIPEAARETADLAFVNGETQIGLQFRNTGETRMGWFYTVKNAENGKWYLSADNVYDVNDKMMANEVGKFDHITWVIKPDYAKLNASMVYMYVNGEYLGEAFAANSSATQLSLWGIETLFGSYMSQDCFSYAYDNLAINIYDDAQGSDVTNAGIAELNAYIAGDYKTQPLYNLTNIVYNLDYSFIGAKLYAEIYDADGNPKPCYNFDGFNKNVTDGVFARLGRSLENYTPPKDLNIATFTFDEGYTFSLSKEAQEIYMVQHSGNTYTVKRAGDNLMQIYYYDAQGVGRQVFAQKSLIPFAAPNLEADDLKLYGKLELNKATPTIQIFKEWRWDINNDGYGDAEFLPTAYTVAEIEQLYEDGYDAIHLVPVYETLPLMYTIYSIDGDDILYSPDYSYADFTDLTKLDEAVAKVANGDHVVVKLYGDVKLSASDSIVIPEGATVDFDLNGYSVTQKESVSAIGTSYSVFAVSNAATLNLYSSVSEASVAQLFMSEADSVLFGSAIISANATDYCTINIGAFGDNDGENISLYGGTIVNARGKSEANGNKTVVTLNGGSYYSAISSTDNAMFPIATLELEINITDALVVSTSNASVFSAIESTEHSASINVKNSKLLAGTINESTFVPTKMIKTFTDTCKLYAESSVFVTSELNVSGITLDKYNLITANISSEFIITSDGIEVAYSNGGLRNVSVDINYPADMNNMFEADVPYVITPFKVNAEVLTLTFDTSVSEADRPDDYKNIVSVTWQDLTGGTFATTNHIVGSTVSLSLVKADFGIKELDNGWYNEVYDAWTNKTDGSEPNAFVVLANKNNIIAPATKTPAPALKPQVSIEMLNGFGYNIYLPKTPSPNVTYVIYRDGVVLDPSEFYTDVKLGEKEGFIQIFGAIALDTYASHTITVEYTVSGEMFRKSITIDLLDYAYGVDEQFGKCSDESKLVYAMMQYKLAAYKAALGDGANENIILEVEDYFLSHGLNCTCKVTYTAPSNETVDNTNIASLASVSYKLYVDAGATYTSKYLVTVAVDSSVTALTAKITDATLGDFTLTFVKTADGKYTAELPLWFANKVISFTLTTAEGNVTGTYSLAKYIADTDDTVAKSLYVISAAAYEEKLRNN